jgi:hypothetical protein
MLKIYSSLEQDLLRAVIGKFRKSFKLKMLGITAGDSPHGEGKSRTYPFSVNSGKKCNSHCFLYSSASSVTKYSGSLVYSFLIIVYSLLIIVYSLLIIFYSSLNIVFFFLFHLRLPWSRGIEERISIAKDVILF